MTIIYSKKMTPAAITKIKKAEAFIAYITENFIKDDSKEDECRVAELWNKPMYAIIKKDVNWDKYKKYPWRKTYQLPNDISISKDIKQDLDFIKKINNI